MTKEAMMQRMKAIEKERFYLSMKDRWTPEDYRKDGELFREWLSLSKQV